MACKNGQCGCKEKQNTFKFLNDDGPPIWVVILMVACLFAFLAVASMMVNKAFGGEPPVVVQVESVDYTNVEIPTSPVNPIPVTIISVHDADTLTCTVHLPFDIDLPCRSLRCYGFDAWEISKIRNSKSAGEITDEEVAKGHTAKDELVAMLFNKQTGKYREGVLFVEPVPTKDPYGRTDCWWWIKTDTGMAWMNVAQWGKDNGHQRKKAKAK